MKDKIKFLLLDGKVYKEIEEELSVSREEIKKVVYEIFKTEDEIKSFRRRCLSYARKHLPDETRKRLSESAKKMWKNYSKEKLNQIKKNISIGTKRYMESRSEEEIKNFRNNCKKAYHDKVVKTNLERYGVEHTFQSKEFLKKSKMTNLEKYGVEWFCLTKKAAEARNNTMTKINRDWFEKLDGDILEFPLKRYSYDIKKDNYLIEINPAHTHNSTFSIFNGKNPLNKNYRELIYKTGDLVFGIGIVKKLF